jgi:chromosome segregation ATPase
MVEAIMYVAGGFLFASLCWLTLLSAVHHRAVRLTERRLEDSIPVSLTEIQADRDKLRARFAMQARRLEVTVEQLEAKVTHQLGEIARKSEAINRLKAQLTERIDASDALGAKLRGLGNDNDQAGPDYGSNYSAAAELHAQALANKDSELARAALEASELTFANETQRVEIVMLKTQLEQFKARIEKLEREAGEARKRLFDEQVAVSNMTKELEKRREAHDDAVQVERAENEFLRERIANIAAQVAHLSMSDTGSSAGTSIATILKEAANGVRPGSQDRAANGNDAASPASLVDRIRKLQTVPSSAT